MKVKTYLGHDVPEGASHYGSENNEYKAGFYGIPDYRGWYQFSRAGGGVFNQCHTPLPKHATELPEEETKPDWDSAPEWADRLMRKYNTDELCWADDTQYKFLDSGVPHTFRSQSHVFNLIEMRPEINPEFEFKELKVYSDEWVDGLPPVGCGCVATWLELPDGGGNDFCRVLIKGYFGPKVWFTEFDGNKFDIVMAISDCEFRKPKTQDEKDREAFIDAVNGEFSDGEFDRHDLVLIASRLFDTGFTA